MRLSGPSDKNSSYCILAAWNKRNLQVFSLTTIGVSSMSDAINAMGIVSHNVLEDWKTYKASPRK
jgi:hypothetical protein